VLGRVARLTPWRRDRRAGAGTQAPHRRRARAESASLSNRPLIDALGNGADVALNIQGDVPTLEGANRRTSSSPRSEAQLGEWTAKAVCEGRGLRLTDECQILNLAKNRSDLLTGPGGAPDGSVKG